MNSKHILKLGLFVLICLGTAAFVGSNLNRQEPVQPKENNINKANFAISHGHCNLGFSGVMEELRVWYPKNNASELEIDFTVNTKTLSVPGCGNGLTEGVQSEEMFDGTGSNYIKFKTDDVFVLGKDWYQLRGIMRIKGIERVVRLRTTPIYDGKIVTKWVVEGLVNLDEFGIHADTDNAEGNAHVMFVNLTANMEGC